RESVKPLARPRSSMETSVSFEANLQASRRFAIIPGVEGQAMPLHDWTDERGWDSVHPFWLAYLVEWIQPRLPEGYKAFLGGVPALTVASGNGKPDVSVRQWEPKPPAEESATDTAVMEPDLEVSAAIRLD